MTEMISFLVKKPFLYNFFYYYLNYHKEITPLLHTYYEIIFKKKAIEKKLLLIFEKLLIEIFLNAFSLIDLNS